MTEIAADIRQSHPLSHYLSARQLKALRCLSARCLIPVTSAARVIVLTEAGLAEARRMFESRQDN